MSSGERLGYRGNMGARKGLGGEVVLAGGGGEGIGEVPSILHAVEPMRPGPVDGTGGVQISRTGGGWMDGSEGGQESGHRKGEQGGDGETKGGRNLHPPSLEAAPGVGGVVWVCIICYDPCDAYANLDDDDAGWLVADSPTSDYHSASIRAGLAPRSAPHRSLRQSNARLLCSTAHRHDIAALVARMVHSQDQCAVAHTELHPSELALAADDEGYDSSEMDASSSPSSSSSSSASPSFSSSRRPSMALHRRAGLEYRRSSDLRCGAPCVSKMTRFRKDRNHVRRRTADK
nr:hypothetical protein CFP56_07724 [Quercus suber]